MKRKIGIGLLYILIGIQFFHPKKNVSTKEAPQRIEKIIVVPDEVQSILKIACYDCHSNTTNYPWYNKIQPIAWWLDRHIINGKRKLNFSEYGNYTAQKKTYKLKEIKEVVEENEMPLKSYSLIHQNAKLSVAQKEILIEWVNNSIPQIK